MLSRLFLLLLQQQLLLLLLLLLPLQQLTFSLELAL